MAGETTLSSEVEPAILQHLRESMTAKDWAWAVDTWEEVVRILGTSDITLNKLGLISKLKPDGSMKHCFIWDLLRSQVNRHLWQGHRFRPGPP